MVGTARAKQKFDPARGAAAWMEVEAHRMSVVPLFDGKLWMASTDIRGEKHNAKRAIRCLSATSATSLGAVESLLVKIEQEQGRIEWD